MELDGKRNKGREALRQLKKSHSGAKPGGVCAFRKLVECVSKVVKGTVGG